MKITGACFCGEVSFIANIDPEKVRFCMCTDCQLTSGSVGRHAALVSEADVKFSGTPKTYVKTADSGNKRALAFCGTCGSQIYSAPVDGAHPAILSLRVGLANERALLAPRSAIWGRSKLPWIGELDRLPTADKQS